MKPLRIVLAIALAAFPALAYAAQVPLITGPISAADLQYQLNTTIQSINANLGTNGAGTFNQNVTLPVITSGVNTVSISGSATGVPVRLYSSGTDTNIGLNLAGQGSGVVSFGGTNSATSSLQASTVTSSVNGVLVAGAATGAAPVISIGASGADTNQTLIVTGSGTGGVGLGGTTAANAGLLVPTVASSVNAVKITSAATGTAPIITVGGGSVDANIALVVSGHGSGVVALGGTTAANSSMQVSPVTSAVDFVQVSGSAAGSPGAVTVAAVGTDANVDLVLTPKGSGVIKCGVAACFTANNSEAASLGSTGVTGHGTVLKWLTIKDSAGTAFYIPVF